MAIGWGGFAQGLTAGSSAAARAYQARIDAEEQEFRQSERAREADFRRDIKEGSAAAQTEDQTGYGITDVATGKTTYVPEAAKESGGLQAYANMKDAEGNALYTIGEAPVRYSEARVQGGKTLGQVVEDPNVATPGGAARGLQADWDKNKMQRLEEIALKHDRPERAAAYGQLTSQKLAQELARGEIDMLPGKKTKQDLEIEEATRKVAMAKLEDTMMAASRSPEAALKFYNDRDPSDGPIEIVPNKKTGKNEFVQTNADGSKTVVGKPYADWDEGRKQILSEIPGFAKVQFEADIKHKDAMAEIAERGKWMLKNTGAEIAGRKFNMNTQEQATLTDMQTKLNEMEPNTKEYNQLAGKMNIFMNGVLMRNGIKPSQLSAQREPGGGRDYTTDDVDKYQKAKKTAIENAQATGNWPKAKADQDKYLLGEIGPPITTNRGRTGTGSGAPGPFKLGVEADKDPNAVKSGSSTDADPTPTDSSTIYGRLTSEAVVLRDAKRGVPGAVEELKRRQQRQQIQAEAGGLMEQQRVYGTVGPMAP